MKGGKLKKGGKDNQVGSAPKRYAHLVAPQPSPSPPLNRGERRGYATLLSARRRAWGSVGGREANSITQLGEHFMGFASDLVAPFEGIIVSCFEFGMLPQNFDETHLNIPDFHIHIFDQLA